MVVLARKIHRVVYSLSSLLLVGSWNESIIIKPFKPDSEHNQKRRTSQIRIQCWSTMTYLPTPIF